MRILINEEERDVVEHSTVSQILKFLDINIIKGIALAVNDQVLPKSKWDSHQLYPDDKLLLIQTFAGG